ncbi:MAG TPA: coenzyme F420-0:L-glutamate ligase [Gammaproteobacteria bacterium]|jgi:coenzyme F420-0:L-glutamate ligase/coenzyme F420-1:gamma-L-glutamate ligase|nr:coenzyme F420-0:L-glutamate ligase [Chromatiales bacterium]MCP4925305.1 coenzyme F420-0:L-glutamate ligase [Gammaproteobacteria bacterium]MDP7153182.1 coenzyme F420-0:L-glutamate ligase [Gammaproteobacteria bacterium]MDP7297173.1 coenzyme F420-0:L-glutamate ligase [Gammaproteobacteria bacterium]HJP37738.1 coenzyme F420-0:L-glutamate ligase [Gammaproteobacteria bacterium]
MPTPALTFFPLADLPLIEPGNDLAALLIEHLGKAGLIPQNDDVLVIAQKIVSKAEDCFVDLQDIKPSPEALKLAYSSEKDPRLAELILRESARIVRDTPKVLIVEHRLGIVLANAGIDRSNVNNDEDTVLLLPVDPDASARRLKATLDAHFGVRLGIVITDSVGRPWRLGTTGIAIGCAGLAAMHDMRGLSDMFGRVLQVAEVATADCVAGAATLLMGEGAEAIPVVLMRGLQAGKPEQSAQTIVRSANENLFE